LWWLELMFYRLKEIKKTIGCGAAAYGMASGAAKPWKGRLLMHMSMPLAFASMPGGVEWVVIGLVALLLFGKRLPGIARSLGQSLTEFKSGLAGKLDVDDSVKPEVLEEKVNS
ncbi:MAG: twin-arginine translocase TatA/TatE family subunit, partial [Planctomycetes bacterium]|nr:twin-arginine translocase TatA/TatE family subunit [Planctomycetota bacterium]